MPREPQTTQQALQELKDVFWKAWGPPLERLADWLDRQLRRSPRLYRWLSR